VASIGERINAPTNVSHAKEGVSEVLCHLTFLVSEGDLRREIMLYAIPAEMMQPRSVRKQRKLQRSKL